MLSKLFAFLLIGSALAIETIDVNVDCGVSVTLTFSDDGTSVSPTVPCSSTCSSDNENIWLRQTIYQRYESLEDFNQMVEVIFSGDDVLCRLVPVATDEEISAANSELGDSCQIVFDEEQTEDEEETVEEPPCPEGYFLVEEIDTCYLISDIEAQWYDAECSCAATGGTLAIINTELEQQLLSSYLEDSVWIGLSDAEEEGVHLWRDGSPLEFESWAESEPSNSGTDDCVEMSADSNFAWKDEDCKVQRRYLCEEREPVEEEPEPVYLCPEGWILSSDESMCFRAITSEQTWEESQSSCEQYGGNLASLSSEADFEFAKTLISEDTWIGLNDRASEGNMIWTGSSSAAGYTSWSSGEPNNSGDEDCIEMRKIKNYDFNDGKCSTKKRALCSLEPVLFPRETCPEAWKVNSDETCYLESNFAVDQATAASLCETWAVGGQLVTPASEEENNFIKGLISEKIWIGYTDQETEGVFRSGDGEEIAYNNWANGEPNNWGGSEHCANFYVNGDWNDDSCSKPMRFVCEIPLAAGIP